MMKKIRCNNMIQSTKWALQGAIRWAEKRMIRVWKYGHTFLIPNLKRFRTNENKQTNKTEWTRRNVEEMFDEQMRRIIKKRRLQYSVSNHGCNRTRRDWRHCCADTTYFTSDVDEQKFCILTKLFLFRSQIRRNLLEILSGDIVCLSYNITHPME